LPHYVAPGFPAFFLLLFRGGGLPVPSTVFARRFAWSVAGFFVVLGLAIWGGGYLLVVRESQVGAMIAVLGMLVLCCGVAACLATRGRMAPVVLAMLAASFLIRAAGTLIHEAHPSSKIADVLNVLPEATRMQAAVFTEPSLVFYTRAGWKMRGPEKRIPEALEWLGESTLKKPRAGVFLLREWSLRDALEHWRRGGNLMDVPPGQDHRDKVVPAIDGSRFSMATVEGYNNGRSSWVEVLVVTPTGLPGTKSAEQTGRP
jgi:hypothetical protein